MNTTIELDATMRRVLVLGDLHLKQDRLDDQRPVLDFVADRVKDLGIDVLVINGDLAGSACPHIASPAERNALISFVKACQFFSLKRPCTVIIVRGNHDVHEDWQHLDWPSGVHWCARPTSFELDGGLLHVLPYPDKSWVASTAADGAEASTAMIQGINAIMHGFAAATPPGVPSLLVGHVGTSGAEIRKGQPLAKQDIEIPTSMLKRSGADMVLLSHIHYGQEAASGVVHVGSPYPTRFGEYEDKSVAVWHVAERRLERVPTPHPRFATADVRWNGAGWDRDEELPFEVDERTRLRLRLIYEEGEAIDEEAAKALFPEAGDVRTARAPIPKRRERAPEVVQATGPVERFIAYEKSESREVDQALAELAREIVSRVGCEGASGGGQMRELELQRVELTDIGKPGRRVLDMDTLPDGIIGIDATNGAGKTTLMETSCFGAAFRKTPARTPGFLHSIAASRTACVDTHWREYAAGLRVGQWRLLHHLDKKARTGKAHIYRDGEPYSDGDLKSSGSTRIFDRLIARAWPTWEQIAATRFQVQGGDGSWSQLTKADRRRLLSEMLGLYGLQQVSDEARGSLRTTQSQQGVVREHLERMGARLAEWRGRNARLTELRTELDGSEERVADMAARRQQLQDDISKALAWSAAQNAARTVAEIERLRQQRAGYATALADAETKGKACSETEQAAKEQLDALHARNRDAAAAQSLYREREQAFAAAKRRASAAHSVLTWVASPGMDLFDAEEVSAREALNIAGADRAHDAAIETRIASASAELGRCQRTAGLLDGVPCRGEGDYALCELLADAQACERDLPDARETVVGLKAQLRGVSPDDLKKARDAHQEALRRRDGALAELRRWEAVDEAERQLAGAEANRVEQPDADGTLALDLAAAESEHRAASTATQTARDDYTTARTSLQGVDGQLARLGDPPEVPWVPEWTGSPAEQLQRNANDVGEELRQLREKRARAEGEVGTLEPLVEDGADLPSEMEAKQEEARQLADKAARLGRIEHAFGAKGIQAVLMHDAGPSVSEATNAHLVEAYEWDRFKVRLETLAEKASGDGFKDAMDVMVYDSERDEWGLLENLSPGEIDMVQAAFMWGLAEHHSNTMGMRWRTAWADEPGSNLTQDNAHRWMRMARRAMGRMGVRKMLLVTHDPTVKATCDRVLKITDLDVDATESLPDEAAVGDTDVDRSPVETEAPQEAAGQKQPF